MFSAFPGGWPGIGLLVLRTVVGALALAYGAASLGAADPTAGEWVGGGLAIVCGAALLVGFLTPGAGAVVVFGMLVVMLSWLWLPAWLRPIDRMAAVLIVADAVAIALLGPGAYSLDARLFGRREIFIPHESHPPRP